MTTPTTPTRPLPAPAAILADMDAAYQDLKAALAGLTDAEKQTPGAAGRWRVKDVLSHLARWDDVAYQEMTLELQGTPSGIDYNNYLETNDRWEREDWDRPLAEAEAHFEAAHARVMDLLRGLPDAQWTRPIRAWAKHAVWHHYPEHTAWIREWRAAEGSTP